MALHVTAEVGDRSEPRLAAVPRGFVAASDRAVTRWTAERARLIEGSTTDSAEDLPGPLEWLADAGRLAWGPVMLDGDGFSWTVASVTEAAVGDLDAGAGPRFALTLGAVSGDGRRVAVALGRPAPRGAASRLPTPPGVTTRVAVVDPAGALAVEIIEDNGPLPVSLLWGDGPLLLGTTGHVHVHGGEPLDLEEPTAARALAASPAGALAAGTASGAIATRMARWRAHDQPVVAVAWHPADAALASGGMDGWLRIWSPAGELLEEFDAGAAVHAIAWIDATTIVLKRGGQSGSILVLRDEPTG